MSNQINKGTKAWMMGALACLLALFSAKAQEPADWFNPLVTTAICFEESEPAYPASITLAPDGRLLVVWDSIFSDGGQTLRRHCPMA